MKVVVLGGGFGGLAAVHALDGADLDVTLIDRRNFHLFQPLLYQVATGALSPANIAAPLRGILRKQTNARVVLGEVTGFDLKHKRVLLADAAVDYDYLIAATGSSYNYFGHPDWAEAAPSLKSVEDATGIRARILHAFERAELAGDSSAVQAALTFVVIGGGPTGVELAGAIAELARATLPGDFRQIEAGQARIVLVEADARVLLSYPESLADHAHTALTHLGVDVRTHTRVTGVDEQGVAVSTPLGESRIDSHTVIWAAGVVGTPIAKTLAEAASEDLGPSGRIPVTPQLTISGHDDVFVIGDMAFLTQKGKPLPAVAPVAMQQGAYAAKAIKARISGDSVRPFKYHDRGSLATIGRSAAVADLGLVKLHGFVGWVAWLTVHLMMLVRFENRVLVLVQWAWNYVTRGRSARLITGDEDESIGHRHNA